MIRYYTAFSVLMITLVAACVSPANVDFEAAEQQLVIYSHFGPDELMKLYLTHTRDPLKPNEPFEPVENAKISVYKDGVLVSDFNRNFDVEKQSIYAACYETKMKAEGGCRYTIEVDVEGYKIARAEETVPDNKARIVSFELDDSSTEGESYRLIFSDNDEMNYYQLIIKALKYELMGSESVLVDEEIVDYELIGQINFPHFNAEGNKEWMTIYPEYAGFLFTGVEQVTNNKEVVTYIPKQQNADEERFTYKYKVELHTVSEAYFQYHESVEAQLIDQNYLTDPSRIYNNIENGFGNFSAYNTVIKETERSEGE